MTCQQAVDLVDEIEQMLTSVNGVSPLIYNVRPYVYRLCAGDPHPVDEIVGLLGRATGAMTEHKHEGFENARVNAQNWTGDAADDFKDYITRAEDANDTLVTAISNLQTLYGNYQDLINSCHADLVKILTDARDGIQSAIAAGKAAATQVLLAVATVAIGFIDPAAGVLELITTTIEGTVTVGSVMLGGNGGDYNDVIESLNDALSNLEQVTSDKARTIKQQLTNLFSYVSETGGKIKTVAPQPPVIITAPSFKPCKFYPNDPEPPRKKPIDKGPLVKQPPTNSAITARLGEHRE